MGLLFDALIEYNKRNSPENQYLRLKWSDDLVFWPEYKIEKEFSDTINDYANEWARDAYEEEEDADFNDLEAEEQDALVDALLENAKDYFFEHYVSDLIETDKKKMVRLMKQKWNTSENFRKHARKLYDELEDFIVPDKVTTFLSMRKMGLPKPLARHIATGATDPLHRPSSPKPKRQWMEELHHDAAKEEEEFELRRLEKRLKSLRQLPELEEFDGNVTARLPENVYDHERMEWRETFEDVEARLGRQQRDQDEIVMDIAQDAEIARQWQEQEGGSRRRSRRRSRRSRRRSRRR